MKKTVLAVVFAACAAPCGAAAVQTWSGAITDSMCKAKHTMTDHGRTMPDRECTQACTGHGAQYALVTAGTVYKLRNHEGDLKTHAGHVVNITGDLSGDTIRVSQIEMPSAPAR
jgi:hypothetical protein